MRHTEASPPKNQREKNAVEKNTRRGNLGLYETSDEHEVHHYMGI